jgi:LysM repeat protein
MSLLLAIIIALGLNACGPSRVNTPPPSPRVEKAKPPAGSKRPRVEERQFARPPGTVVHEVAPLESIWRISKMYDVSMETILSANHLKADEPIQIGQKLVIPGAKTFRNVIPLYPNPEWKYVVVHHTATEIGKAVTIHNAHYDRGFLYGLGYDFLIDNGTLGKGDGQIEVSPRWIKQQEGAHCKAGGMNSKGIGVALVGNFNVEQPTQAQMDSLVYLTRTLCAYYDIPMAHVVGHREVEGAKTECPGRNFPWRVFVTEAARGLDRGVSPENQKISVSQKTLAP